MVAVRPGRAPRIIPRISPIAIQSIVSRLTWRTSSAWWATVLQGELDLPGSFAEHPQVRVILQHCVKYISTIRESGT
ncbi:hypothetical protein ES703_92403 [subsurface metagenome]